MGEGYMDLFMQTGNLVFYMAAKREEQNAQAEQSEPPPDAKG